jgi:hypothetical protein
VSCLRQKDFPRRLKGEAYENVFRRVSLGRAPEVLPMDAIYILTCAIVWRKTADLEAGWELIAGLQSRDPQLQFLAQTLLVESGEEAMSLLERALTIGVVSPQAAAPCMAEILRQTWNRRSMSEHGPARAHVETGDQDLNFSDRERNP